MKNNNKENITGIILAEGKGSRLYPLTKNTPKPLLMVGDKPMVMYVVDQLISAGIKKFVIVIGKKDYNSYLKVFNNFPKDIDLKFAYGEEDGKGVLSALSYAESFVDTEKIIVTCADVIIESSLTEAVDDFANQKEGARIIGLNTYDTAGFSPLKIKDNKILEILPKDKSIHNPGVIDSGTYLFHSEVFKHIENLLNNNKDVQAWDLNKIYIEKNQLYITSVSGWWSDAGNSIETFHKVNKRYSKYQNKTKVLILGSGMAGLGASITFRKAGIESILLEKENYHGGLFSNSNVDGCDFDFGPKLLLLDQSENSNEILSYLGDNSEKYPVQESAYISKYGLLHFPLQRHLIDLPESERNKILKDLKTAQEGEHEVLNYRDWLVSKYGQHFAESVLIPYEEKKWQISLDQMDFRWALKRPVRVNIEEVLEGSKKLLPPTKSYYYPKIGNISSLSNAMAKEAGKILYNHQVEKIDMDKKLVTAEGEVFEYDYLISTLPLDYFNNISEAIPSELKTKGNEKLKRLSINVFNLVFKGDHDLDGTAIYFPEKEFIFRRVSILQNLCPALKVKGKTSISVEVSVNPENIIDMEKLYERVLKDLLSIKQFSKLGNPIAKEMFCVDFAYPLQLRGLSNYVADLHRFSLKNDVYHCGRGGNYDYCNGDEAYEQGVNVAHRIIRKIKKSKGETPKLSLSVGIPSYKSGTSIINTVMSLRQSVGVGEFEISVYADGPMDKEIEKKLISLDVNVIQGGERKGQTFANKRLGEMAKTDILVMTQDDVLFDKLALKIIMQRFSHDLDLTMLAPRIEPLPAKTQFEKMIHPGVKIARNIAINWKNGNNYLSSIGRCLAYQTSMVKRFEIDDNIVNCDAYYYFENKRLGGKFGYENESIIFFRTPQVLSEHLKQVRKFVVSEKEMSNYLKMDLNTEYKLPSKFFMRTLIKEMSTNPIYTSIYLAISFYARTRPKSFYKEVTNLWEIDESTKNTKLN